MVGCGVLVSCGVMVAEILIFEEQAETVRKQRMRSNFNHFMNNSLNNII